MTTHTFTNRYGHDIKPGDLVDVLTFGPDGIEGGEVVETYIRRTGRKVVESAKVRQASGAVIDVVVRSLVLR